MFRLVLSDALAGISRRVEEELEAMLDRLEEEALDAVAVTISAGERFDGEPQKELKETTKRRKIGTPGGSTPTYRWGSLALDWGSEVSGRLQRRIFPGTYASTVIAKLAAIGFPIEGTPIRLEAAVEREIAETARRIERLISP